VIFICTNISTIAESVEHDDLGIRRAVAKMFLGGWQGLEKVSGGIDYATESDFREWHGGTMTNIHKPLGLLAYDYDNERKSVERINRAIDAELALLLALEIASIARSGAPDAHA
jgi:hypothetical protein